MSQVVTASLAVPRSERRWVAYTILALLTVVGAIITWFRVPTGHQDRVWAEDSNIFLGEALQHGPWAVLFNGYAGYQHLVPRLVLTVLEPTMDLGRYAYIVFAICSVLTGLTAAAVFWLSCDLVTWVPARVALGLATVLIPLATQETVGNLADLHTYGMWLAPWLLLYRPRAWWSSIGWALVAFLVVMTEIQAVFFVFLLLLRLRRRDRIFWPVGIAFVIGSAIQVATAVTGDRQTSNGPLSIPSTVLGWMINAVIPLVNADPVVIREWVLGTGVLVAVLILIPIVAATVVALVFGSGEQRVLTVALLLGSAAIYTGSAWANSGAWFMYAEKGLDNIGELVVNIRYGVAAGLMLVAVVFLAVSILVRRSRRRTPAAIAGWIASVMVIATLAYGCTTTYSLRGWVDRWGPSVRAASAQCAVTPDLEAVRLPVAPDRSVDILCSDVLRLSPPQR